jgi:hypothetical protein
MAPKPTPGPNRPNSIFAFSSPKQSKQKSRPPDYMHEIKNQTGWGWVDEWMSEKNVRYDYG